MSYTYIYICVCVRVWKWVIPAVYGHFVGKHMHMISQWISPPDPIFFPPSAWALRAAPTWWVDSSAEPKSLVESLLDVYSPSVISYTSEDPQMTAAKLRSCDGGSCGHCWQAEGCPRSASGNAGGWTVWVQRLAQWFIMVDHHESPGALTGP